MTGKNRIIQKAFRQLTGRTPSELPACHNEPGKFRFKPDEGHYMAHFTQILNPLDMELPRYINKDCPGRGSLHQNRKNGRSSSQDCHLVQKPDSRMEKRQPPPWPFCCPSAKELPSGTYDPVCTSSGSDPLTPAPSVL